MKNTKQINLIRNHDKKRIQKVSAKKKTDKPVIYKYKNDTETRVHPKLQELDEYDDYNDEYGSEIYLEDSKEHIMEKPKTLILEQRNY